MKALYAIRFAVASFTAALLLTACSNVEIGGGGGSPLRLTPQRSFPEDLLYVSNTGAVMAYTYPAGNPAGLELNFVEPGGICSDKRGDVFVVDLEEDEISEYPHGASSPTNIVYDFGYYPFSCAVDPVTGDLAVAGGRGKTTANLAIYHNDHGAPTRYNVAHIRALYYCTYDDSGNLFTEGDGRGHQGMLLELPNGSTSLSTVKLNRPLDGGAVALQWVAHRLVIDVPQESFRKKELYQIKISGTTGTVVRTIHLDDGMRNSRTRPNHGFWIEGRTLIEPRPTAHEIVLWDDYRRGGQPSRIIETPDSGALGLTVSVGHPVR